MAVDAPALSLFVFGLSGVGKTTLIEQVCKDKCFYLPLMTVTRAPRGDDAPSKFEYVTQPVFSHYRLGGKFFIDDDDGRNFYGYRKEVLKKSKLTLFYGLPAQVDKIKAMGCLCILIQGEADIGLSKRHDPLPLRERRSAINKAMQATYYGNPDFVEKMDLVLTNHFCGVKKLVLVFKRFVGLKLYEQRAWYGDWQRIKRVIELYHAPIEGLRIDSQRVAFWMQYALQHSHLRFLFYSKILEESRRFL